MNTHEGLELPDTSREAAVKLYNTYVLGPGYAEGYMANFREGLWQGIDIDDPDLKSRLDTPLSQLLANTSVAGDLSPAALRTRLTVRDTLALGAVESIFELPYLDDEHDPIICDAIANHVPEVPLLNGLAPVQVARWLYPDRREIPLSAISGRLMTIGDVIGTDMEAHYRDRIAALTSDEPDVDIAAQAMGVYDPRTAADGLTAAIEGVTHTLDSGGQ